MPAATAPATETYQFSPPPSLGAHLASCETMLDHQPARWGEWKQIAYQWAETTNQRYDLRQQHSADDLAHFDRTRERLDTAFAQWLPQNYAPLSGQALPAPHHLHHIPAWLAYQRSIHPQMRPALLVMDGMGLPDWLLIRESWVARHPTWHMQEQIVLAQIPSITAISRQALISGTRPTQFAATIQTNRAEAKQWAAFWQQQEPNARGSYTMLANTPGSTIPDIITSRRTDALCIICGDLDAMVHGETQGTAGFQAGLRVWLYDADARKQRSNRIEILIQQMIDLGYTIFITSDHGHTEAIGHGQPNDGVLVETRSKRARIYRDPRAAQAAQETYPGTIAWHEDGILPTDMVAVVATDRHAFTQQHTLVVSHGGVTLDEVAVPLITVQKPR